MDETYIRIQGQWRYFDRAIDPDGHLADVRLNDTWDLAAAEAFFRSAWMATGLTDTRITIDGHDTYPHVIRNMFGDQVRHGQPRLE